MVSCQPLKYFFGVMDLFLRRVFLNVLQMIAIYKLLCSILEEPVPKSWKVNME